jgi:hypothetical protein
MREEYIAIVGGWDQSNETIEANANLVAAAPAMKEAIKKLVEAINVITDCGDARKVSLYDEEGVEGWQWTSSNGQEWTEIGGWDNVPLHPVALEAIEFAQKQMQ